MSETNHSDLIRAIERDNVISYKRRPELKSSHKSNTDDEDADSAPSLRTSAHPPLPELLKDKRKMMIKPVASLESKPQANFVEKEVRLHENILLKQRNNLLASDNLRLKTRITVLEKENQRLQKGTGESAQVKPTTPNVLSRGRPADITLRAIIMGLRKEVQDLKKENLSIKTAVKFTNLKELQVERDHLAEESIRLKMALEEELSKRVLHRSNQLGVSAVENRLQHLAEKNSQLAKEYAEMTQKCKKYEQILTKTSRAVEQEKNNSKALATARKAINEKDNEIEQLKAQLRNNMSSSAGAASLSKEPKEGKVDFRRLSIDRKPKTPLNNSRETNNKPIVKAIQSKPAPCSKCEKLEQENKQLVEKCKQLEEVSEKLEKKGDNELPSGPVEKVVDEEVAELRKFLLLRFKAHRLFHEQSQKYLVNCETTLQDELKKEMTVRQLMESLLIEPFCIVNRRYLEVLVVVLAYGEGQENVSIDQQRKVTKQFVLQNYLKLLPIFQIMSQQKEEEMFIQVAELVTTYQQQILAALMGKRNGEGTISYRNFFDFFKQIELEQEYIDFIITQIILESVDLHHLNFHVMLEIFYMPQISVPPANNNPRKKFQVNHEQVVHEEDEEYEESKSHLGSKKVTLEREEDAEESYPMQESPANSKIEDGDTKNQSGQRVPGEGGVLPAVLQAQGAEEEVQDVGEQYQEEWGEA